MIKSHKTQNNKWPYLLIILFSIISVLVFSYAISQKIRKRSPSKESELPPRTLKSKVLYNVTRIIDGDTLAIIGTDQIEFIIRLYGIDSPEKNQAYGIQAKTRLEEMIGSKQVNIEVVKRGKYGRYIANVYIEDRWLNKELIEAGLSWCDENKNIDPDLQQAQRIAQKEKYGLWKDPHPIPPWRWREFNK